MTSFSRRLRVADAKLAGGTELEAARVTAVADAGNAEVAASRGGVDVDLAVREAPRVDLKSLTAGAAQREGLTAGDGGTALWHAKLPKKGLEDGCR